MLHQDSCNRIIMRKIISQKPQGYKHESILDIKRMSVPLRSLKQTMVSVVIMGNRLSRETFTN